MLAFVKRAAQPQGGVAESDLRSLHTSHSKKENEFPDEYAQACPAHKPTYMRHDTSFRFPGLPAVQEAKVPPWGRAPPGTASRRT